MHFIKLHVLLTYFIYYCCCDMIIQNMLELGAVKDLKHSLRYLLIVTG